MKESVFAKLKVEVEEAIDNVFAGDTWIDGQPCIVPETIAYRMAEAAMSVLRVACEQQKFLLDEGYHVEREKTEV